MLIEDSSCIMMMSILKLLTGEEAISIHIGKILKCALTKSAIKKLNKMYESQKKKYNKWKEEEQERCDNGNASEQTSSSCMATDAPPVEQWDGCLDEAFCHFVKGSFGKRQGLEFSSDMGPFVHSFHV